MTKSDREAMDQLLGLHLDPLKEQLHRHDESLYGNGREGLVVEVDRLKQRSEAATLSRNRRAALWVGAVVAGIGNTLAFLFQLIK
ncbi:MAG: hypothetical protein FJY67_01860 [Calditrichaeota bacterium]|nr:hypothetical protein [Calditrichota bacterium]